MRYVMRAANVCGILALKRSGSKSGGRSVVSISVSRVFLRIRVELEFFRKEEESKVESGPGYFYQLRERDFAKQKKNQEQSTRKWHL